MGNKDHALSIPCQILYNLHQSFNLLRGQGSGRLIQDQRIRTAVKHLQYLHTLLHPNGNILDLCVRIDLHAITLRQLHYLLSGGCLIDGKPLYRLNSQNNIIRYRKWLDQHKMLVNHTDPDVDSILWTGKMHLFPFNKNLSAGRLIKPAEHIHHRTFTGSVFS